MRGPRRHGHEDDEVVADEEESVEEDASVVGLPVAEVGPREDAPAALQDEEEEEEPERRRGWDYAPEC